ncbi:ribosomal protein S5 domain 2-like protein [Biscogniauxia marginata]|nr:ribosomal protein S5 domain 2-like protein [Biscogniauxia marginata]
MATQPSLTLSSATFAKLSPHPYLLANLQPPDPSTPSSRTNGRQPHEARQPNINTSSLTHAHGSAVMRTGDTTVICGVRGETLLKTNIPNYRAADALTVADSGMATSSNNELRDYDLLVPNIELATGSAPNFLPGVPPTTLAQTLSTRLYSLLHSTAVVDVEDLRIYHNNEEDFLGDDEMKEDRNDEEDTKREVKAYWVLYIDVLFISLDGNPFDAAWAAVLAALRDTKLPQARWNADQEMVLCSQDNPSPLNIRGLPVACTAAVFTAKEKQKKGGGQFWILVDPDRLEESLCDETATMVVDRTGGETKILGISKSGGTVIGPELMRKFIIIAETRWEGFRAVLL